MQNNSFIIAAIILLFSKNKLTIFLLNKSIISRRRSDFLPDKEY